MKIIEKIIDLLFKIIFSRALSLIVMFICVCHLMLFKKQTTIEDLKCLIFYCFVSIVVLLSYLKDKK